MKRWQFVLGMGIWVTELGALISKTGKSIEGLAESRLAKRKDRALGVRIVDELHRHSPA